MILLYPIMFLLMRGWIGKKKDSGHDGNHELSTIGQRGVMDEVQQTEAERTKKVAQKML